MAATVVLSESALLEHSHYFDRMLALIPARLYFPKDTAADEDYAKRKKGFLKVSSEKSSKLAKKEARNQALKEKLNPENFKTVPEIQREAAKQGATNVEHDGQAEEQSEKIEDESDHQPAEPALPPAPRPATAPAQSMDDLRARVQQRIEEMRKKRKAEAHEMTTEDRHKRREERKKKKEEKRKARKLLTGEMPKKTEDGGDEPKLETLEEEEQEADESSSEQELAEDIKFGTFDFSGGKPVPSYLTKKKQSLQQTLKRLESEKEHLKELAGTEEGQKLKEDMQWNRALKRAKGEKLKDDPKRIKAAIKREQKKKIKSVQEWKERNAAVAKQQAERQEKRQANIDNKIQRKKDKKMGKKKGGGGRAGFEGKKRSFLNK